jgi:hypothetical protein
MAGEMFKTALIEMDECQMVFCKIDPACECVAPCLSQLCRYRFLDSQPGVNVVAQAADFLDRTLGEELKLRRTL